MKCNTDSASRDNPSISYYGFYIRDYWGDLLYAAADSIVILTNMVVEIIAIWKILQFRKGNNMLNIKLKSDFPSLIKILKGEWKICWEIINILDDILSLLQVMNI